MGTQIRYGMKRDVTYYLINNVPHEFVSETIPTKDGFKWVSKLVPAPSNKEQDK
jgi:hypothetical protein